MDRNAFSDFGSLPGHAPKTITLYCPVPVLGVLLALPLTVNIERAILEGAILNLLVIPA
jgi:hypothetical protein